MGLIVGICRYVLPLLTIFIFGKCFMTLFIGHPVNEDFAYIEDISTNEKMVLNTWETSIGKSKTCDIMLSYDVISRFHSVICRRVDGWYVFDTLSKNGTYVKKDESSEPVKVEKNGALIENGNILCFSNKEYYFKVTNDPVIRVGKRKIMINKSYSAGAAKKDSTAYTVNWKNADGQAALIKEKTGTIYLLVENAVTIGSNKNSDIRIQNPTVSRLHAVMTGANGQWYITDKNSTNGTTVNGERLHNMKVLKNNDRIGINDEIFIFTDDYR